MFRRFDRGLTDATALLARQDAAARA